MRTIEEIVEFSRTVPGYYDPDELTQLATLTRGLGKDSTIVEIGVECGRSASVFLQCPENWASLHLIDARTHNVNAGRAWTQKLIDTHPHPTGAMVFSIESTSEDYARGWLDGQSIDLLHIDADHDTGIWVDCRLWLPRVKVGGVVVFHDYRRTGAGGTGDVFPEVTASVDRHVVDSGNWLALDRVNTQLSARRIA